MRERRGEQHEQFTKSDVRCDQADQISARKSDQSVREKSGTHESVTTTGQPWSIERKLLNIDILLHPVKPSDPKLPSPWRKPMLGTHLHETLRGKCPRRLWRTTSILLCSQVFDTRLARNTECVFLCAAGRKKMLACESRDAETHHDIMDKRPLSKNVKGTRIWEKKTSVQE